MRTELLDNVNDLIQKTSNGKIRWKRINKTTFEYKKGIQITTNESSYPRTINTITTLQIKSGNFLMGNNTFYNFIIFDEDEKEVLVEIEADANEKKEYYYLLENLYKSIINYYEERSINVFNEIIS